MPPWICIYLFTRYAFPLAYSYSNDAQNEQRRYLLKLSLKKILSTKTYLIGTHSEHNIVDLDLVSYFAPKFVQPQLERLEARSVAHVIYEKRALCVLVEFVSNLKSSPW